MKGGFIGQAIGGVYPQTTASVAITAQASFKIFATANASGKTSIAAQVTSQVKMKAPGGAAISGLCRAAFSMSGPGGFSIAGRAIIGFKLLGLMGVDRQENTGTRLPLYRRGVGTYWKGRH